MKKFQIVLKAFNDVLKVFAHAWNLKVFRLVPDEFSPEKCREKYNNLPLKAVDWKTMKTHAVQLVDILNKESFFRFL